ncbi:hypothetical protein VdG1_06993 [Verticillium dahliae VDG1]|nr:Phosphomevalonate kinase [Verticillium dahliae VDG2]KAF3355581.1 hypothetical protein VdG1_06993 [Verticillium dahliae VDG1]
MIDHTTNLRRIPTAPRMGKFYDPTATPYASMSGMTHQLTKNDTALQYSGYVAPNALPEFGYDYYP